MPTARRSAPASANFPVFTSRPHHILTALVACATLVVTWLAGGEAPGASLIYAALAATPLIPLIQLHRGGHRVDWAWLLPALALALYIGLSLGNPSHLQNPDTGSWVPNPTWVRWLPTTMDRSITGQTLIPLLATLLLGGALAAARLPGALVRQLWLVLYLNGLVLALIGATLKFSGTPLLMGLFPTKLYYFFATFTYRNHWAAYALLMVALGAGFTLSFLRRGSASLREGERARFFAITTLLIAFTPILAGSRSGSVMMSGLGLLFAGQGLFILYRRGRRGRRRARVLAVLLAVILLALATLAYPALQRRFAEAGGVKAQWSDVVQNIRVQFTRDTLRMGAARPWFGWGLGTFPYVFPLYQGDYLRDETGTITVWVNKAHNDWAQAWAELGVGGLIILLLPVGMLVANGRHGRSVLRRSGMLGAVAVAGYAVMDFPCRNLAVAAHLAVLLATYGSVSGETSEDDRPRKQLNRSA